MSNIQTLSNRRSLVGARGTILFQLPLDFKCPMLGQILFQSSLNDFWDIVTPMCLFAGDIIIYLTLEYKGHSEI